MLQAHYRSTLDLTDDALLAAEKGYKRLMEANKLIDSLSAENTGEPSPLDIEVTELLDGAMNDMCDDFNTPKALAKLFEVATKINALHGNQLETSLLSITTLDKIKSLFRTFLFDVFGLKDDTGEQGQELADGMMNLIIDLRKDARSSKDWGTADKIRDALTTLSIQLKDGKDGTSWSKN